ncbi:helix-turn-helix domain-containing protein [Amycolatopsis sp. cg5]|uniref:helix-turn-helix domain-containing protein n=1 Tax=Amycolatopsis sp. cg5 TaxID=3238802 RepID=UPI0035255B2E
MSATRFGDFLRFYRMRILLTQSELADRAGVSVRGIGDMERGRVATPHRATVDLLATALGLLDEEAAEFRELARGGEGASEPDPEEPRATSAVHTLPPLRTPFMGRERERAALDDFVANARSAAVPQVAVVHGQPGAGKSTFVIDAGSRLANRFEDGCLFVDLYVMGEPVPTDRAAHRLLCALGVDERVIPADLGDKLALYQSLLFNRTLLLVLDNAVSEAQVRPLLGGGPGTVVLVTSRSTLAGLNAGYRAELGSLDTASSIALLETVVGAGPVAAEPAAVARVAELCGGVPLALVIAGNRIASRPQWTIAGFAGRLEDERRRLSVLSAGDLRVRAACDLSCKHLSPDAVTMFARLALVPGPEIGVDLAAVAAGQDVEAAEAALEELANASLLGVGASPGRYVHHDLLRVFARDRLERDTDPAVVTETGTRVRHWLLAVATKGAAWFDETAALGLDAQWPTDAAAEPGFDGPDPVRTREAADRWLTGEVGQWLGALRAAAELGEHEQVLGLAQALGWFALLRGHGELWREVFEAGAAAADALGDTLALERQLDFLSWTLWELCGRIDDALAAHKRASALADELGDPAARSRNLYFGAPIHWYLGERAAAIADARMAAELFAGIGYEAGEHISIAMLGWFLGQEGKLGEAEAAHRRSVVYLRAKEPNPADDELLASFLARHAECLTGAGDLTGAFALLDEADTLYRKHDIRPKVVWVAGLRAAALVRDGRAAEAAGELTGALELAPTPDSRIETLVRLAEIAESAGGGVLAREHRIRALAECAGYNTPAMRAVAGRLAGELGVDTPI